MRLGWNHSKEAFLSSKAKMEMTIAMAITTVKTAPVKEATTRPICAQGSLRSKSMGKA
jgi:hypothetical protein